MLPAAGAASLEGFVKDAAISLLERLDVTGAAAGRVLTEDDKAAIEADQAELAELKAMWDAREIKTREYRAMRKKVQDRIGKPGENHHPARRGNPGGDDRPGRPRKPGTRTSKPGTANG